MKTILVADDDPVMIKLLELNLKRSGFRVEICREGLSVVPMALESLPALAVIDLMLPGKSGLELIEAFQEEPALAKTPIIVVTGQGKGSTREQLLAAGARTVFTKPFSPTLLITRIRELLEETDPA
ncbi:MAG: response regulator [Verrucomicrobiota bacterium]